MRKDSSGDGTVDQAVDGGELEHFLAAACDRHRLTCNVGGAQRDDDAVE